jgi:hypothetical protein
VTTPYVARFPLSTERRVCAAESRIFILPDTLASQSKKVEVG